MAYFHLKLVPPRPSFPHDATGEEMAAMQQHAAYWREQASAGTAIVVGPVFAADGAFGMAVLDVEDANAAKALGDADPVLLAGLGFRIEISPMPSIILRPSAAGNSTAPHVREDVQRSQ
ncbi:YciI family protein [Rhizobium mayense]|uniref:YciI family protein n=1 Tax=Rhizobium mayense TaxID=1312184 RepID=A0ABT7JUU4_9HYPH|nr:YciI family protein [Rhizobium mayense]MDL2399528.1 YciI family protein [Rhizobium mayense]